MKLQIEIYSDLAGYRWCWKISNGKVSIYGEKIYKTEDKAQAAAQGFLNKCLTDRSTWSKEYR